MGVLPVLRAEVSFNAEGDYQIDVRTSSAAQMLLNTIMTKERSTELLNEYAEKLTAVLDEFTIEIGRLEKEKAESK